MATGQGQQPTEKLTAAGRRYMGFLAALNTGDDARLRSYIADHFTADALEERGIDERLIEYRAIYAATGGMAVKRVEPDGDHKIVLHVESREDEAPFIDVLVVSPDFPHKITVYTHAAG